MTRACLCVQVIIELVYRGSARTGASCMFIYHPVLTCGLLTLSFAMLASSFLSYRGGISLQKKLSSSLTRCFSDNIFRTEVADSHRPSGWSIDYHASSFFIGSCFSENISSRLRQHKFHVLSNPQGILFNPVSIEKCIVDVVSQNDVHPTHDIVYDSRTLVHHAWDAHSDFSSLSKDDVVQQLHERRRASLSFLRNATVAFVTLGTSKVHALKESGRIVANCHQQPGGLFTSRLLSFEEIHQSLRRSVLFLRTCNPTLQIVFTVSPVRHTRDTMVVNSLSKSLLLAAIHRIVEEHPTCASYFPSYEYMMDELRDYRWYADDMIHPSAAAVDFIYQRFQEKYMPDPSTRALMKQIETIQRNVQHRPRFPQSPSYVQHLRTCLHQVRTLDAHCQTQRYPHATDLWQEERKTLEEMLSQFEKHSASSSGSLPGKV